MSEALVRADIAGEADASTANSLARISPQSDDSHDGRVTPADRLDISAPHEDKERWNAAKLRNEIIKPIIDAGPPYHDKIKEVSAEVGKSKATLYRWIEDFLEGGANDLAALCPRRRDRPRRPKISLEVISIIHDKYETFYLTKQRPSERDTCVEVEDECRRRSLPCPSFTTIRRYIKRFIRETGAQHLLHRRYNKKLADDTYALRDGTFRTHPAPWFGVQVDHTKLDIMVVDEQHRLSIGRAYLTYAICPYSRMILGFRISLDPVGAHSTGLCLLHAMFPKDDWLKEHGIPNRWPCYGKPASLHFDNAKEFLGEMIINACDRYDILIEHRPIRTPHFAAHVERTIRTLNRFLHTRPGTTFSNPQERAEYDSDEMAIYTLTELETQVTEWITGIYHKSYHRGIRRTPQAMYEEGVSGAPESLASGRRILEYDRQRMRLDFTPFENRTVQRTGVHFDNLVYTGEVLAPYVGAKDKDGSTKEFHFHRDPRRIDHIWFYADDVNEYYRLSLRDPLPDMSLWEWKALWRRETEKGKAEVDRQALFETRERIRQREDESAARTRSTRRQKERRLQHGREMAAAAVLPQTTAEPEETDWSDVQRITGARLL